MCICIWYTLKQKRNNKKIFAYSTSTSRVVPHHSTILAVRSLTSRFGWDVVLSTSYGRKRNSICVRRFCSWSPCVCPVHRGSLETIPSPTDTHTKSRTPTHTHQFACLRTNPITCVPNYFNVHRTYKYLYISLYIFITPEPTTISRTII